MAYETSTFNLKVRDHSRQNKTTSFPVGLITGANMAARITARDNLINAFEALTDGLIIQSELTLRKKFNNGRPSDASVSVSKTLTVEWYDATTLEAGSTEFGCLKLDNVVIIPESDDLYIDEADGGTPESEAFKDAFEAFAVSPRGNAVVITNLRKYH